MLKIAFRSLVAALVLTAVLGFATRVSSPASLSLPSRIAPIGSIVEVDGKPVGSRLAAQAFDGPGYFHPPSIATDYNAAGTSFANLGRRTRSY